jgi:hypothetical protein
MTAMELGTAYHRAIAATLTHLRGHADAVATEFHVDNATALQTIWAGLEGHFAPGCNGDADGRTARWRCRFRVYREGQDEPEADSDAELRPDLPGTTVIAGLPNVASEVIALAAAFHSKAMVLGLSREELSRKLDGLRPTLSRRGGNAVWRLEYKTIDMNTHGTERNWLMRVDIIREVEKKT